MITVSILCDRLRITNDPKQFALGAKKIHIDVDPASLSKIINVDVPVVGSAKECLSALIVELNKQKIDTNKLEPWLKQISEWRNEHGLNHSMLDIVPDEHGKNQMCEEVKQKHGKNYDLNKKYYGSK